jgi:cell shape-determining protein MreD
MFKKYFYISLLIIFLFIIQQGFLLTLSPKINLLPVVLVFVIFFCKLEIMLFYALLIGFLSDLYSPYFAIYLFLYFIITGFIYFLKKNFLTNRSLISFLILNLLAVILLNLFLWIIKLIGLNLIQINFSVFFFQVLSNLILSFIIFLFISRFTNLLTSRLFEK